MKALDAVGLGLIDQICSNGYRFRTLTFRSQEHQYLDAYEVGSEAKYGYDAYRVYRHVITEALLSRVDKASIPVNYNQRISGVVSEDRDAGIVTFIFADGNQEQANLLIGADGIHSEVRRSLFPNVKPVWSGAAAVSCVAPTATVRFPDDSYGRHLPVSIHGPKGAVHIAPQNPQGTEMMAAIQWPTQEQSKEGWKALARDKCKLRELMKAVGLKSEIATTAIEAAPAQSFSIWPFYTVPKLDKWCSKAGRVLLVGDAAHGIPPTGGQGANQALEDVYTLSLLLVDVRDGRVDWESSVRWWQHMRQERVDKVIDIATEIRRRRKPGWNGQNVASIDSTWLFGIDIRQTVQAWVEQQVGHSMELTV